MGENCQCLCRGQQEVRFEGNLKANIAWIFESPGRTELKERRPVVGDAGKRWQGVIEDFGFRREEFFIANSARCMIDKDQFNDSQIKSIVKSCRTALKTSLEYVHPKVIVAAGGIAQHAVLGLPIAGVKKRRGEWRRSEEFNCWVLLTVHPSFTLRNESYLPRFKSDVKALREFVDNDFEFKEFQTEGYKEVSSIVPLLAKKNFSVGIDTETQDRNWADPNSIIVSYQVSSAPGEGSVVFLHEEVETEGESDFTIQCERGPVFIRRALGFDQKISELGELLARSDIKKYMMTNFDVHRFHNLGLTDIKSYVMDVQAAAHVLDSVLYLNGSLEHLEEQLTDMDASYNRDFDAAFDKSDMLKSLREDREAFINYGCADSDGALRAGESIRGQLLKSPVFANYYVNLVHPVTTTVLFSLERNGLLINRAELPQVATSLKEQKKEIEQRCLELVAAPVLEKYKEDPSLNRRRFVADILFSEEGFGLKPLGYTAKTKEPKVDKDTLKRFQSSSNKRVRSFLALKLKRDELHTLYSRYIKNLPRHIYPDNRVHPSYSIPATSSGRAAARNPNSMNWPKRMESAGVVRKLIIAPPGKCLLNIDANQAELRWVAHEAQDPRMLEAFRKGEDLHLTTAKAVSGKDFNTLPAKEVDDLRYKAKPCIAEGSLVLTDKGLVPVEKVSSAHLVWDGVEFVEHGGLIYKGIQEVITYDGLTATPDHQVFTGEGISISMREIASTLGRQRIAICEIKGKAIRYNPHNRNRSFNGKGVSKGGGDVQSLRGNKTALYRQSAQEKSKDLSMSSTQKVLQPGFRCIRRQIRCSISEGQQSFFWALQELWRQGNQMQLSVEGAFYPMDDGRVPKYRFQRFTNRQDKQQWALRTRKYKIGHTKGKPLQQKNKQICGAQWTKSCAKSFVAFIKNRISKLWLHPSLDSETVATRTHSGTNNQKRTFAKVYDIRDCGPRNRFTVSGKLVHNCNFGLIYGMSPYGYKEYALDEYGIHLTQAQANLDVQKWFALYRGVQRWHEQEIRQMHSRGWVQHALGRIRYLPELFSPVAEVRARAERVGINFEIQGPSSDTVLLVAKQMYDAGFIDREEIKLVLFVHDNLMFEVAEDKTEELAREAIGFFENVSLSQFGVDFSVPFKADAEAGLNYAELEELAL